MIQHFYNVYGIKFYKIEEQLICIIIKFPIFTNNFPTNPELLNIILQSFKVNLSNRISCQQQI